MSTARQLADLLDANGDVKSSRLDNVDGLPTRTGQTGKYLTNNGSSASWSTITLPKLDAPSITGTLAVDDGGDVTHTIGNWSDELTYVTSLTNCSAGAINSSGQFVITHTSGTPSYTIKATTDNLGLDDSSVVTKNILMNLSAPTINSPADVGTNVNLTYVIVSTSSDDTKIILDFGSSNFTYQSVSNGTGTKVGNTVEVTGFSGNPEVTIQFTAEATYSVKAKSTATGYGDSAYSSIDTLVCSNIAWIVATGGTITTDGDYKVHTFTTSGSFVVSTIAAGPAASTTVTDLIIGGGSCGMGSGNNTPGGGDATGQSTNTTTAGTLSATSYTVVVGAGGAAVSGQVITTTGGTSSWNSNSGVGASGAGAVGTSSINTLNGMGGDGAGAVNSGSTGGAGLANSITGSSVIRGGGGGGGLMTIPAAYGTGGSGGGGTSVKFIPSTPAEDGAANTGSGGGGGSGTSSGHGGSGVVIIRYKFQ